jgi:hypothetical protein
MIRFLIVLAVAYVIFALVAEANSLWLIIIGSGLACFTVISACFVGYGWAQKQFQDDVEL